jgi:hypothetical protein
MINHFTLINSCEIISNGMKKEQQGNSPVKRQLLRSRNRIALFFFSFQKSK